MIIKIDKLEIVHNKFMDCLKELKKVELKNEQLEKRFEFQGKLTNTQIEKS